MRGSNRDCRREKYIQVRLKPDLSIGYLLMCIIPKTYTGHMRQSQRACHIIFNVKPWRLCISDLDGSSRNTLFTMIISSLWDGQQPHTRRTGVCLPFREPTVWTEPCFSLRRARRHQCEGQQATQTRKNSLNQKKIPPSRDAVMSAQLQDACSQECADNLCHVIRHPKPRKSNWY